MPTAEDTFPLSLSTVSTNVPNRLLEQTRLSILSWNPVPRQGRKVKNASWHVVAIQEAIEYLQHESLTNHTFHSDITVKSIYLHDNRNGQHQTVREGQSGLVLQAVISRASFWRIPRNGQSYFTMMSFHINNTYAKKRGIAKNLLLAIRAVLHQQQVDLVAGDCYGAAWRRQSGSDSRFISSFEEAFVNTNFPVPLGPTPLWLAGGVPGEWSDVCGFLKPPGSENEWQVRVHGAFLHNPLHHAESQGKESKLPS